MRGERLKAMLDSFLINGLCPNDSVLFVVRNMKNLALQGSQKHSKSLYCLKIKYLLSTCWCFFTAIKLNV